MFYYRFYYSSVDPSNDSEDLLSFVCLYWCDRSTFPQSGIQVARHMFFTEFKQKVDRHGTFPVVAVVAAAVSGAKIAKG